jgi:hypothetical protein
MLATILLSATGISVQVVSTDGLRQLRLADFHAGTGSKAIPGRRSAAEVLLFGTRFDSGTATADEGRPCPIRAFRQPIGRNNVSASESAIRQSRAPSGFNAVSPAFFATLRTPVLVGRVFEDRDGPESNLVAIVNDAFVSQYMRGENPIGRSVQLGRLKDHSAEIVGVVAEIRNDSNPRAGLAQVYVPFEQNLRRGISYPPSREHRQRRGRPDRPYANFV